MVPAFWCRNGKTFESQNKQLCTFTSNQNIYTKGLKTDPIFCRKMFTKFKEQLVILGGKDNPSYKPRSILKACQSLAFKEDEEMTSLAVFPIFSPGGRIQNVVHVTAIGFTSGIGKCSLSFFTSQLRFAEPEPCVTGLQKLITA